ncbi:ArsR family transcriptional regulator [Aggregatibacter segnis ATCC 33393]|uniref:ArsR family transcriptional regulator n=1 Tax=Aggregatibacter segnis ATCC 33393 TaxID=888057 RepID=E6KYC4_9PAST|nr:ArsR family transcriptional regulator [Aggregatibacter segnis ATCC 33393]
MSHNRVGLPSCLAGVVAIRNLNAVHNNRLNALLCSYIPVFGML